MRSPETVRFLDATDGWAPLAIPRRQAALGLRGEAVRYGQARGRADEVAGRIAAAGVVAFSTWPSVPRSIRRGRWKQVVVQGGLDGPCTAVDVFADRLL